MHRLENWFRDSPSLQHTFGVQENGEFKCQNFCQNLGPAFYVVLHNQYKELRDDGELDPLQVCTSAIQLPYHKFQYFEYLFLKFSLNTKLIHFKTPHITVYLGQKDFLGVTIYRLLKTPQATSRLLHVDSFLNYSTEMLIPTSGMIGVLNRQYIY